MYYRVYLQCNDMMKKFIVETCVREWDLLKAVNAVKKSNYIACIKPGRKGWKKIGISTLEELLVEVGEFRFHHIVDKSKATVRRKEYIISIPTFISTPAVWKRTYYLDGIERTFIKFSSEIEYFKIDAEWLIKEFAKMGITLKKTVNPEIFWCLADLEINFWGDSFDDYKYWSIVNTITDYSIVKVEEEI